MILMSSFYQNNIISVSCILYFYVFIVDIGISSSSEFVKSNENSCAELITETSYNNMQSDNVDPMYNISFSNSNGTENVDTFTSEIGWHIIYYN